MNMMLSSLLAALLIAAGGASALPRFALVTGARCSSCHVNPTGGGMRNRHGFVFGSGNLTMTAHGASESAGGTESGGDSSGAGETPGFDPRPSESLAFGGDFRTQFLFAPDTSLSTSHLMTAALYGEARFSRDLSLSVKFDLVNPTYTERSGPEVFVLARVLPGRWYLKAGSFHPAYGIRIDDHTGYTRGGDLGFLPGTAGLPGLIFVPNYRDIGMEIGGSVGGLEVAAGMFNGTGNSLRLDFQNRKAFAARVEFAVSAGDDGPTVMLGASGYDFGSAQMGGVHAGIGFPRFAFYGEADVTQDRLSASGAVLGPSDALAAFFAGEALVTRGVWATARFDFFDPQRGASTGTFRRLTAGLELFPWPFIEIRPQYRFSMEDPSADNDLALVQLHAWF